MEKGSSKKLQVFVRVLRAIVVAVFVWLLIESAYFHVTGNYIVFNGFYMNSAENVYQEMHIVDDIYNIRHDSLSVGFTSYFVPAVNWMTVILLLFDVLRLASQFEKEDSKRALLYRGVLCLADVLIGVAMLLLTH